MGRFADHDRFKELLALLRPTGGVSKCLYYPGMTPVPPGFDRYAGADARKHDYGWHDVCPAYALALVSKGSYELPRDKGEMEVLWDELGGDSTLLWPQVEPLVRRAWDWLDVHAEQSEA